MVGKLSREQCPVKSCTSRVQAHLTGHVCAPPRWCPKVAHNPGSLVNAGPSSLRRSNSSISNAVEPSEHRGAGMGDPHAVVHTISLINTQGPLPTPPPRARTLRFSLTPHNFELLGAEIGCECEVVANRMRVCYSYNQSTMCKSATKLLSRLVSKVPFGSQEAAAQPKLAALPLENRILSTTISPTTPLKSLFQHIK